MCHAYVTREMKECDKKYGSQRKNLAVILLFKIKVESLFIGYSNIPSMLNKSEHFGMWTSHCLSYKGEDS